MQSRVAGLERSERGLDRVMAACEALQHIYGIVKTDDCGFCVGAHHLFAKKNPGFAELREKRGHARAGFDKNEEGNWIATDFEEGDFLRDAVIADGEIQLFEIVNHGAARITDGAPGVDDGYAAGDVC